MGKLRPREFISIAQDLKIKTAKNFILLRVPDTFRSSLYILATLKDGYNNHKR